MAHQRLGVDAPQLLFAHRERHDRHIGRFQALVGQLFVEGHVGVAVDRGNYRRLRPGRELLDVGDDGLVVGVAERRVDLLDVLVGYALAVQERTQNLVGGAWVDVVGAQQEEALGAAAVLAHQVFHCRNCLLVGRSAGVEDVRRHFFAFVLHRVEQQTIELLEYRQYRFARHRRPAAEHHRDLVLGQQLAAFFGEQRPVGRWVHHHRLQHLAVHPTFGVDFIDGHQGHVLERRLGDGHGPGQRMQDADLDGLGCLEAPANAHRRHRGAEGEGLDQTASLHVLSPLRSGSGSQWRDCKGCA